MPVAAPFGTAMDPPEVTAVQDVRSHWLVNVPAGHEEQKYPGPSSVV